MKTILIADRERSIRKALELFFISRGDFVFMAKTAAEAESILKGADPNIVIYDLQLPGTPALELYERLKKQCGAKFIFTSVYPEIAEAEAIKKLGDCRYLEKPFTTNDLKNALPEKTEQEVRHAG